VRKLVAVCCALPVVALAVPALADAPAPALVTPSTAQELFLGSVSGDGTRAYFRTAESLVATDGDTSFDFYERNVATGGLRLISDRVQAGPDELIDVGFSAGPSADGSHVIFSTAEQIVDADDDTAVDVYDITPDGTVLLSDRVQDGADQNVDAASGGMTADGTAALIITSEPLLGTDGDSAADLYRRKNGVLTLISGRVQPGPHEEKAAGGFIKTSKDGSRIVFSTTEALVADDTDSAADLYLHDVPAATTTLVSDGPPAGPDSADHVDTISLAVAPNGSRVFFLTKEALLPEDTDGAGGTNYSDVYEYRVSDGVTTIVSDGADPDGPNQAGIPFSAGRPTSDDGSHVLFTTTENLVPEDTDSESGFFSDTYERVDGTTTRLVTDRIKAGPDENQGAFPHGISRDGSRIVFVSFEQILDQDKDSAQDAYLRENGTTTTMLSDRSTPGTTFGANVSTAQVNPDITRVFFTTAEPLTPEDGDAVTDLYERTVDAGVTTLLSDRAKAGPDDDELIQATALSEDASKVFFAIDEQLVDADGDAFRDVYLANSPPLPDPVVTPTPGPDPTPAPTAAPTATPGPTVKPPTVTPPPALKAADVVTLPSAKKCVSRRRFRIKLRTPRGTTITRATVFINGKKKKTFTGKAIRPTVDLRGLPKGRIKVKVEIRTADGRTARLTRKYRTCAPRKR
jgi:hypothetical protein